MADEVDGEVRAITGRVERMDVREKEHRLAGKLQLLRYSLAGSKMLACIFQLRNTKYCFYQ